MSAVVMDLLHYWGGYPSSGDVGTEKQKNHKQIARALSAWSDEIPVVSFKGMLQSAYVTWPHSFLALKMVAESSSETLVSACRTTQCHSQRDHSLNVLWERVWNFLLSCWHQQNVWYRCPSCEIVSVTHLFDWATLFLYLRKEVVWSFFCHDTVIIHCKENSPPPPSEGCSVRFAQCMDHLLYHHLRWRDSYAWWNCNCERGNLGACAQETGCTVTKTSFVQLCGTSQSAWYQTCNK
jgi:hypothetical protein